MNYISFFSLSLSSWASSEGVGAADFSPFLFSDSSPVCHSLTPDLPHAEEEIHVQTPLIHGILGKGGGDNGYSE